MSRHTPGQALAAALILLATLALPAMAEETTEEQAVAPPPDEIMLKNGSRILGTVVSARDGVLVVTTEFAGDLSISMDQISQMNTTGPATLVLADESVVEDRPLEVLDSEVVVASGTPEAKSYAIEDLLVINPEDWELGRGYKWTGLVSFAFAIERGNSKTDELDYKLDTNWRSDDDRYTLKMDGEIDEANDQKNADNWTVQGKYDNFFSDHSYWGLQALAEQDEFADLDLRYLLGPYVGREFYTDPIFMFAAEAGVSYVNEDFITAPDQEYPAANWAFRMSSDYLGGDSRLYFDQIGIWNMDETSDLIINSTFGLGFPLLFGFEAAAEILLEYDSGAVEGVEELDETYNLRLGYTW